MKLNGNIKCPLPSCGRTILFILRTHDASRVEFSTRCKKCGTVVELTVLTQYRDSNSTQLVEQEQPEEVTPLFDPPTKMTKEQKEVIESATISNQVESPSDSSEHTEAEGESSVEQSDTKIDSGNGGSEEKDDLDALFEGLDE